MFDSNPTATAPRDFTALPVGKAPAPARQIPSSSLFDGAVEIRIDHHGQEYRLRQTRNGKLILTK